MSNATGDGGGARRPDGVGDHRASIRSCCTCEPRIPRRRAHTGTGTHVHIRRTNARGRTQVHVHLTRTRAKARARARTENRLHLIPGVLYSHGTTRRDADARVKSERSSNSRAIIFYTNLAPSRSPSSLALAERRASSISHLVPHDRIPNHSCSEKLREKRPRRRLVVERPSRTVPERSPPVGRG